MPKFTVREFAKSVGLDVKGADYIGAGVMLKVLQSRGIAKEVDRINTSARGRKSVVYDVPSEFVLTLDTFVAEAPKETAVETVETAVETEVETVETEVETVTVEETVPVETVETEVETVSVVTEAKFYYGDDEDEDMSDAA